jgi:hypothetical protein
MVFHIMEVHTNFDILIFCIYMHTKGRGFMQLVCNSQKNIQCFNKKILIDWCFTPTLAIFQLYRDVNKFYY